MENRNQKQNKCSTGRMRNGISENRECDFDSKEGVVGDRVQEYME